MRGNRELSTCRSGNFRELEVLWSTLKLVVGNMAGWLEPFGRVHVTDMRTFRAWT